jgi:DnaJ-domain-containing protein 1
MSNLGIRPSLEELIAILFTVKITAVTLMNVDNPSNPDLQITLRFNSDLLKETVPNWAGLDFKPQWLFDGILEALQDALLQRRREEQWVSKEDRFGASIESLMVYCKEEMQKASQKHGLSDRVAVKFHAAIILRLQELLERRQAGGVYSKADTKREKARKAWMDDEAHGHEREAEQKRQREAKNGPDSTDGTWYGPGRTNYDFWRYKDYFTDKETSWGPFGKEYWNAFDFEEPRYTPPPSDPNKKPWYEVLGISASANASEIRRAARKLTKALHPDKPENRTPENEALLREINEAKATGLKRL